MKMMIVAAALVLTGCATSKKDIHGNVAAYKAKAQGLVKMAQTNGDKKEMHKISLDLISSAKPIIAQFKTMNPKCGELLDTIVNHSSKMTTLSLKAIERDYHDGEILPTAPDNCYNAKELIVHPATVTILTGAKSLNGEGREQIVDEMEEVIAHIDELLL